MSRHDPTVTLRQVADQARRAQELCTQNTLAGMLADWQKRAAFERIMEVLGEAVKRLPPELTARYPAVDWRGIAGMRDRVSHGYDAIDYDLQRNPWRTNRRPRRERSFFSTPSDPHKIGNPVVEHLKLSAADATRAEPLYVGTLKSAHKVRLTASSGCCARQIPPTVACAEAKNLR